jgi:hypothetical protein
MLIVLASPALSTRGRPFSPSFPQLLPRRAEGRAGSGERALPPASPLDGGAGHGHLHAPCGGSGGGPGPRGWFSA